MNAMDRGLSRTARVLVVVVVVVVVVADLGAHDCRRFKKLDPSLPGSDGALTKRDRRDTGGSS